MKNPSNVYLFTPNITFITSKANLRGFYFPFMPLSNSKSDNFLFTWPNKFSMGENSGVFAGVNSRLTLGFSLTRSIMRDDLWALTNK